jgi:hypothetical protein
LPATVLLPGVLPGELAAFGAVVPVPVLVAGPALRVVALLALFLLLLACSSLRADLPAGQHTSSSSSSSQTETISIWETTKNMLHDE